MTNADIFKGSALQVFIGNSTIAFATSHTLSITTNTNEVATKDHGDYPAVLPTTITWEVSCENLYASDDLSTILNAIKNRTELTVKFAEVSNYSQSGGEYSYNAVEPGIIDNNSKTSWTIGKIIGQGKAYVTSYSINAAAGDNASISCTLTGSGQLDILPSGTQGT